MKNPGGSGGTVGGQLEDGSELSEDAGMLDPMYVFNLLYISLDWFHGGDNSQQTNKEIDQNSSPVFFQLEDGFELSEGERMPFMGNPGLGWLPLNVGN